MPRPATAADYAWLYGHAKYMEHKDCFRDHEALLRQAIARTVPGARSVRLLPVCPVRFWFDVLI
jgi:hypothetical protein